MPATTTLIKITTTWTKLSDGNCTVQASDTSARFIIAASATAPVASSMVGINMTLSEAVNLSYDTPVYARLAPVSAFKGDSEVTVIK